MARSNTSSPVVATRNFRSNPRREGVSFMEFLNNIRCETEAYIEMGELDMATKQCFGLMKLEKAKGYVTGQKLMKQIVALKEERELARREQIKVERQERKEARIRLERMNSMFEKIAQEIESENRVALAREQREKEMAEVRKQRELRQLAKENREVWLAHHEELDNTLTHNPFAALQGITPAPLPELGLPDECDEIVEAPDGDIADDNRLTLEPEEVVEMATETEVNTILAMYTAAIEACQEMDQWNEVQDILGDEFFNRNVTEELVEELHEAMELVADNQ